MTYRKRQPLFDWIKPGRCDVCRRHWEPGDKIHQAAFQLKLDGLMRFVTTCALCNIVIAPLARLFGYGGSLFPRLSFWRFYMSGDMRQVAIATPLFAIVFNDGGFDAATMDWAQERSLLLQYGWAGEGPGSQVFKKHMGWMARRKWEDSIQQTSFSERQKALRDLPMKWVCG